MAELRAGVLADDPATLAGGVALPEGLGEIEIELREPVFEGR